MCDQNAVHGPARPDDLFYEARGWLSDCGWNAWDWPLPRVVRKVEKEYQQGGWADLIQASLPLMDDAPTADTDTDTDAADDGRGEIVGAAATGCVCAEPVRPVRPVDAAWRFGGRLAHLDGEPLCPVATSTGYRPAGHPYAGEATEGADTDTDAATA